MKFSLIEFNNGIEKLETYINGINKHKTLLHEIKNSEREQGDLKSTPFYNEVKELLTEYFQPSNKIYEYNSIIVSLYGLLESFVENLIKEYIEFLNGSIPKYSDFPSEIKNNHYEFSANLINNLKLPKYKSLTTKELIVSNLHSCSSCKGKKKYKINMDAFIHHTSNFRDQSINDFFKAVGISNVTAMLLQNQQFRNYLEINGIEVGDAFKILNDLAERRNRISHGSEETNILDIDELNRYLSYINNFACCLNFVVFEHIIPIVINYGDNITTIGKPIATFTSKIVGVEVYKMRISVGDIVFIKKGNEEKYMLGKVNSIQINNESFIEVDAFDEAKQLGICLSCNVDENCTFYLLDGQTIN